MRRVLRLGPALLVYLIACLVVTYHLRLSEITRELKLIGWALAYFTNWRMALGWDASSLDPTAIIWSLSIEEQFYLFWPALFFGCLMLKVRRGYIILGLSLTIVAIMIHRYLLLREGVELTRLYYGTDTRADALLTGCLIALLPNWHFRDLRSSRFLNLKTGIDVAAIFAAVGLIYLAATCSFTDQFLYNGGYTAIAILSGIVTWSVANSQAPMLGWMLGWTPLRWFGKISYGLYLWHWLLLKSTTFYFFGYWDPWVRFIVAVGVAATSFYLVERPFNRMKVRFA